MPQRPRPPADRRGPCSSTAAPMSSSRPPTPVAMTSSPIWFPARLPSPATPKPESPPRVLYAVHDGGIPGTDHPTNRGADPYVATRGERRLVDRIRRHPRQRPLRRQAPSPRSPRAPDAGLETFAFGGPEGCSPCFEGGYTGIPVRLAKRRTRPGHGAGPASTRAPPPSPTATSPRTSPPTANTSSSAPPPSLPRAATTKPATSRSMTAT